MTNLVDEEAFKVAMGRVLAEDNRDLKFFAEAYEQAKLNKPLPALPMKFQGNPKMLAIYVPEQNSINQLIECVAALYEERNKGRI